MNQLFENVTEHASRIEVIRGPANALYGSNALHGVINTVMPMPGVDVDPMLSIEAGANEFLRVQGRVPFNTNAKHYAAFVYADDGGFRDESGYRQAKLHAKKALSFAGGDLVVGVSATDLDQETAGFILGEDAYQDATLNRSNANPEAFRNASSQRAYALWSKDFDSFELDVRPYVRQSDMQFLQHFLPGKPLEENEHRSAGFLAAATFGTTSMDVTVGMDVEWSLAELAQTQDGPTVGSAFLVATRPQGKHYDYRTTSWVASPYVQSVLRLSERTTLHAGLRHEWLQHDYSNQMLVGNTRDDGSACGFGGCLYSRPASRDDNFSNTAPKLSLTYALNETSTVRVNAARGFRAPQATELYRLQNGQQVADLASETVDSVELGWRRAGAGSFYEIAAFAMKKKNSVLRDSDGFNVSNGRSQHRGIEFESRWQWHRDWSGSIAASYGRHTYDFNLVAARGETFVSGREVDTAPRWLASAELAFVPDAPFSAALQWSMIGEYFLTAENQFSYPGHDLFNVRLGYRLSDEFAFTARINNIADTDYADRADFAFGNYRYFPGRGRELFVELRYKPVSR